MKNNLGLLLCLFAVAIFLASCCGAYHTEHVNPLYGDVVRSGGDCPFGSCPPGQSENCKWRPWLNVEYERNQSDIFKVGLASYMYRPELVIEGGINYLWGPSEVNGANLRLMGGFLPMGNTYTTFVGLDYDRWNRNINSQVLSPHLGFVIPYRFLRTTQFRVGYNHGFRDRDYSGWFTGISVKLPVFFFF